MNETEQNPSQEMEKSDDGSGPSKELESIRSRFADALYFLMPGVYHHLLTLSHGPWPHSAALEVSILQWLEDILLSGERCEPRHQHLLEDDGRMLHVLARHLMDDYWWVSVLGLHVILTHDEISGTGPGVAMAIARIKGSGRRLPYTAHDSARFN
jgi:hypothetical protein